MLLPLFAVAQNAEEERGYLVELLEDYLSDGARDVRITGFQGALSAKAMIDELTIADQDGVWFALQNAVMDWDRAALLKGRLEVREISAAKVELFRLPTSQNSLPSAEAKVFSLPELPGAVNIQQISFPEISLDQSLFGEASIVSLFGSAGLADGEGETKITIARTDGPEGQLELAGGFSNTTRNLDIGLNLTEAPDGILANLLDLPGTPSIKLDLSGSAPIDNFKANIVLDSDGTRRLEGSFAVEQPTATEGSDAEMPRIFSADVRGDVAPLFDAQYRKFFGDNIELVINGSQSASDGFQVHALQLNTEELELSAALDLSNDGMPERFQIQGQIGSMNGTAVLLPISGPKTQIASADISLNFDAQNGDAWEGAVTFSELRRDGISIGQGRLEGHGTIVGATDNRTKAANGDVDLDISQIMFDDEPLTLAIGQVLRGQTSFDWSQNQPLNFSDLDITGQHYGMSGDLEISGLAEDLDVRLKGKADLKLAELSRFSAISGTQLSGQAQFKVDGEWSIASGGFDALVNGTTKDVAADIGFLAPLLEGDGELQLSAKRDQFGTHVREIYLATDAAEIRANGELATENSNLSFEAKSADLRVLSPKLEGAGTVTGTARQNNDQWKLELDATGPGNASIQASATASGDNYRTIAGQAQAEVGNAEPYSELVGRDISGAVMLHLEGRFDTETGFFDAAADGTGTDLKVDQSHADQMLAGTSQVSVRARKEQPDLIVFDQIEINSPQIVADMTGSIGPNRSRLRFDSQIRDFGIFAEDLSGPLNGQGVLEKGTGDWGLNANFRGAGATELNAAGSISDDGQRIDMQLSGMAPLALANRYASPRTVSGAAQFDLSMKGPPKLSSLSGVVRTNSASVVAPTYRIALANISAAAQISNGTAQLDLDGTVSSGGKVAVAGSIGTANGLPADLTINLGDLIVQQSKFVETTVNGKLTIDGPLTGGANIAGRMSLGETEIRIQETSASAQAGLPSLEHINEPASVRRTRELAGVVELKGNDAPNRPHNVDLIIDAPSRIFIRGKGLDAELGGQLRLRGTTNELAPEGQFDLIRGRIDILGKRLVLSEGFAQLRGSFDPYIRLVANTDAEDVTISIIIEGLVSEPKISIQSSPELPEDEVLSLLLFGRGINKISVLQAAQLAGALNTLLGKSDGGVVGRLRERFGLDDLDIVSEGDGVVGARVGKYISENIYSEITVDSEGKSEIDLNLMLSPTITAKGKLNSEGDTSIGIFLEKDY